MLAVLVSVLVVAQATTTTQVGRAVGEPLPPGQVIAVGVATLVAVLLGGLALRRLSRHETRPENHHGTHPEKGRG